MILNGTFEQHIIYRGRYGLSCSSRPTVYNLRGKSPLYMLSLDTWAGIHKSFYSSNLSKNSAKIRRKKAL